MRGPKRGNPRSQEVVEVGGEDRGWVTEERDDAALGAACMDYRAAAVRAVLARGGSPQEAQDAVDVVLLDYLTALRKGSVVHNPQAWFVKAAVRGFAQRRKRTAAREAVLRKWAPAAEPEASDPAHVVVGRDDLRRARTALSKLRARDRLLLVRSGLDEASSAELAAELGVSEVNARQLLCRARARARAEFERATNVVAAFCTGLSRRVPGVPEVVATLILVIGGIGGPGGQDAAVSPPPAAAPVSAPAAPPPASSEGSPSGPAPRAVARGPAPHRASPAPVATTTAPGRLLSREWSGSDTFVTYETTCGDATWYGGTPEHGTMRCEITSASRCVAADAPSRRVSCGVTVDRVPLDVRLTRLTALTAPTCSVSPGLPGVGGPSGPARRLVSSARVAPAAFYRSDVSTEDHGAGAIRVTVRLAHFDAPDDGSVAPVAAVDVTFSVAVPCAVASTTAVPAAGPLQWVVSVSARRSDAA